MTPQERQATSGTIGTEGCVSGARLVESMATILS